MFERWQRVRNGQNEIQTALDPMRMPSGPILLPLCNQFANIDHGFGVHDLEEVGRKRVSRT
jgi:hypothetical protein